mgnify:CR=1 FL=1
MTEQHPLTDDLCVQLWQDNKDSLGLPIQGPLTLKQFERMENNS